MVTFEFVRNLTDGKRFVSGFCMEADTKPTVGIANGSRMEEMDTGKVSRFDEDSKKWATPADDDDPQQEG